jgi:hypothetical protein
VADKSYKGIMIAVPCYRDLAQETHASLTVLIRFLEKHGIPNSEYLLSMANIAEARNHIITRFYDETDYQHLLMVDDDMQFMPTMIARALNLKKPVVGTVYNKRQLPDQGNAWSSIVGTPLDGEQEIVDGFQQWKYVGGGVLLIDRAVVTEMLKKMPELSDITECASNTRTGVTRLIRAFDEIKIGSKPLPCPRTRHSANAGGVVVVRYGRRWIFPSDISVGLTSAFTRRNICN